MQDMGDPLALLFPLILFGLLYFFLIRPSRNKIKKHRQMVANLKPGDFVKTVAGIRGRVIRRDDKNLILEIAPGVQIDVDSSKIESKVETEEFAEHTICLSCGAELNPEDRYCGSCGKSALPTFEPPPPPP
jgi:preprotein translocase subunit YajC